MIDFSKVTQLGIPEGAVRSISIAGTMVWKSGFMNLVPVSIAADGSIYNGTGYKEDYRLNSSGVETVLSGAVVSGFIPYTMGGVVRVAGNGAAYNAGGQYIAFYDSDFNLLVSSTYSGLGVANEKYGSYKMLDDGTYLLTQHDMTGIFNANNWSSYIPNVAFIRVSMAIGRGSNFVVTINEEIPL